MYHYIRNYDKNFPHSNILTINNFKKQVQKFSNNGLVEEYKQLFIPSNKVILTFDDGFKDHLYAAEILKKINFNEEIIYKFFQKDLDLNKIKFNRSLLVNPFFFDPNK